MPFFSVITPLYNKEKYIEATLNSVMNQTFNDFEVVIVDDGSTDNSLKIVSKIKSSKIKILKQKNQGPSIARNKAIANAKGKYIAPLDADDVWHKTHLSELKSLIESFPNAGVFCNNYKIRLNKNLIRNAHFNFDYNTEHLIIPDFFDANIYNYIASSSSTAFLKSTFIELGGYDTRLRTGQDLDLWIRFALKYDIAFNPKTTMIYNNYDDFSLSKSELNETRYNFISSYQQEEEKHPSLKKYLDVNRFALVLRCKMNNENELYKKVKKEIDLKNLNLKQKILLYSPKFILHSLKKAQRFLIKNKIYITAFN